MRRHVLEEVGGFNPQLIAGEDQEICHRIRARGYLILHIDQQMALHGLAITRRSQYWLRAIRTGHAFAEVPTLLQETPSQFWQRKSYKNGLHAVALVGLFMVGFLMTLVQMSSWPLLLSVLLFLLLGVRSAVKARWKSNHLFTLFLYGLHSQFQHIPITIKQLSYYYHRRRKQRRRLIEYKSLR